MIFSTQESHFSKYSAGRFLVYTSVSFIVFSWLQKQNLTWAFQSQFLLSIYLPFLTIYFTIKYWKEDKKHLFFMTILLGILSIGTLASGLTIIPIILLFSLWFKRPKWEIALLAIISLVTWLSYFYKYSNPAQTSNPFSALHHHFPVVIKYIFIFLVSPAIHTIGKSNRLLIIGLGISWLILSLYSIIRVLRKRNSTDSKIVLVLCLTYLGVFSALTAVGRYSFGATEALESRYLTVSLSFLALSGFLILSDFRSIQKKLTWSSSFTIVIFTLLLFLPTQFEVFSSDGFVFNQKLAALSLNLSIPDDNQIKNIYPFPIFPEKIAPFFISNNYGIFGSRFFKMSRGSMNVIPRPKLTRYCELHVDKIEKMSSANVWKVYGWGFNGGDFESMGDFLVENDLNQLIGAGMSGMDRPDVDKFLHLKSAKLGLVLYTHEISRIKFLTLDRDGFNCLARVIN
jgi:hypothetical protein